MNKFDKLFKDLINKMYEKFLRTYDDLVNEEGFYNNYEWTKQEESEYIEWAKNYLHKKTRMSKKWCGFQVSMMILSYSPRYKDEEEHAKESAG